MKVPAQVRTDLHPPSLLGQPDVGVHSQKHTRPSSPIVAMDEATANGMGSTPILLLQRRSPGGSNARSKVQESSRGRRAVTGPLCVLEMVNLKKIPVKVKNIQWACILPVFAQCLFSEAFSDECNLRSGVPPSRSPRNHCHYPDRSTPPPCEERQANTERTSPGCSQKSLSASL